MFASAKLSIDKRQESLIINGKSKDGKFFERNDGCETRAELTVKRKWFSSAEEMFQSMDSKRQIIMKCIVMFEDQR